MMNEKQSPDQMSRRDCLKTVGGAMLASTGAAAAAGAANSGFYQEKAFDAQAAKKACFQMMERFGYPISDILRGDDFWVCDFLQGDFAKLGMGGVFWINEKGNYGKNGGGKYTGEFKDRDFGYLGHDIFLLPGQVLPEHRHIGGHEGYGPKMETWLVRYGEVEFFGEYKRAGDETLITEMPEARRPWGAGEDWFQSKDVVKRTAKSGRIYTLEDPESWHFQRAGAEGAIVTEYATYHNHVEFSKPGMAFDSSK
jgi:D-lyxose ketol-isomerase